MVLWGQKIFALVGESSLAKNLSALGGSAFSAFSTIPNLPGSCTSLKTTLSFAQRVAIVLWGQKIFALVGESSLAKNLSALGGSAFSAFSTIPNLPGSCTSLKTTLSFAQRVAMVLWGQKIFALIG